MTGRAQASWFGSFVRRLLLALPAAFLVWWLLIPLYNPFLTQAGQSLARLTEHPSVTKLQRRDRHYVLVDRVDAPSARLPYAVRLTDIHYPTALYAALVLAVPGVGWRRRLGVLGTSLLILAVFHVVDLFFWIEFVYATQLGGWSEEEFGPWARNVYGLGKHVLDLPVKLGLPLLLWVVSFWPELVGGRSSSR